MRTKSASRIMVRANHPGSSTEAAKRQKLSSTKGTDMRVTKPHACRSPRRHQCPRHEATASHRSHVHPVHNPLACMCPQLSRSLGSTMLNVTNIQRMQARSSLARSTALHLLLFTCTARNATAMRPHAQGSQLRARSLSGSTHAATHSARLASHI